MGAVISLMTTAVLGLTSLWFITGGEYQEAALWLAVTVGQMFFSIRWLSKD